MAGGSDDDEVDEDERQRLDLRESLLTSRHDVYLHSVLPKGYEFLLMDNWVKRLVALESEAQTLM